MQKEYIFFNDLNIKLILNKTKKNNNAHLSAFF